ncbi:MAG: VWA domain-containing protein [candidate division WOR-3 bacterium]
MINWALPGYLWFLAAPVVLVLLWLLVRYRQERRLRLVLEPVLIQRLHTERILPVVVARYGLFLLALVLLTVALARPRWGERLQMFKGRGIAVVIALDASKSMLAEDVKPSRLARAKAELSALIDELAGNAVGIVAFAGDAHALCPLTTDLEAAKLFLDIISPELMPVPGTDFGRAIGVAQELFDPNAATRALVLVTDGEDLGRTTEQAVMVAKEQGIRIYPVAISTPEGAPIPESEGTGVTYKKDAGGNVVISRMDERKLILIAQATGGRFFRLEGFSPERLRAELDRLEKEELGGGEFRGYVERYQGFLLAGMIMLFLALVLPERKIDFRRL